VHNSAEKSVFLMFLIIFDTFICQSSRINLFSRNLLIRPLFGRVRLPLKLLGFCNLFHVPMRSSSVGFSFF
jgi:hypothetical protein